MSATLSAVFALRLKRLRYPLAFALLPFAAITNSPKLYTMLGMKMTMELNVLGVFMIA